MSKPSTSGDAEDDYRDPDAKCPVCNKPAGRRCARCKMMYYCSRQCQKEHWKQHKRLCAELPVTAANGAIVCGPHGLDVCGACQVDHRPMNAFKGVTAPSPRVPELRGSDLGVNVTLNALKVDPSSLPTYVMPPMSEPLREQFNCCFSLNEKMRTFNGGNKAAWDALYASDATFGMRESMCAIAFGMQRDGINNTIICNQDEAQSTALALRVIAIVDAPESDASAVSAVKGGVVDEVTASFHKDGRKVPAFVVVYQHNRVSDQSHENFERLKQFMFCVQRNGRGLPMMSMPDTALSVEAFVQLLDYNRVKRLSPDYLASAAVKKIERESGGKVSFFTPVGKPGGVPLTREVADAGFRACAQCGGGGGTVDMMKCGGCGTVYYCTKQCQRAHWSTHKRACVPPITADTPRVVFDLTKSPQAGKFLGTFSLNHTKRSKEADKCGLARPGYNDGAPFMLKVQVPMMGVASGQPMMAYDRTRAFTEQFSPDMCVCHDDVERADTAGYARLYAYVQSCKEFAGAKAYLMCRVRPSETEKAGTAAEAAAETAAETAAADDGRYFEVFLNKQCKGPGW